MASVKRFQHSGAKSSRGLSQGMALGALISCGVIAGSAWGLVSAFHAMQMAASTLANGPLTLKVTVADISRPEPLPKAVKSSRYLKLPESDVRGYQLSADAILEAHQRRVATELALAEKRRKAAEATLLAAAAPAKSPIEREEAAGPKPALVTALVEDVPVRTPEPFDLVLADKEDEEDIALPSVVPLPETRPSTERALTIDKPAERKPLPSAGPEKKNELAVAKPERSLFGGFFSRKNNPAAWPGSSTRVAIYDVSNATVYLPDGTRLRAHSGIGHMRDNPRYEHVKMNGPTPAGIYRLSMREKRFYGVEAIRMTSIDGRDPKNRTGLLTHTNLLRGRIGSHGCVAFQNYEPFLKAFKRGEINMLVVVPELPSSPTQLAALYRKAGA